MSFSVMRVIQREILRPIGPRLSQFQDSLQERRILFGDVHASHLHRGALGQLGLRRQHHHPILDCAFIAHALYLPETGPAIKPAAWPHRRDQAENRRRGRGSPVGSWQFPCRSLACHRGPKLVSETGEGSVLGRVEMNELAPKMDTDAVQQAMSLVARFKTGNWQAPPVRAVADGDLRLKLNGMGEPFHHTATTDLFFFGGFAHFYFGCTAVGWSRALAFRWLGCVPDQAFLILFQWRPDP